MRLITADSGMILIHTCGKPASWDTWVHEEYLISDWQQENYREVSDRAPAGYEECCEIRR